MKKIQKKEKNAGLLKPSLGDSVILVKKLEECFQNLRSFQLRLFFSCYHLLQCLSVGIGSSAAV